MADSIVLLAEQLDDRPILAGRSLYRLAASCELGLPGFENPLGLSEVRYE